MSLPDFDKSHALLVGVSTYADQTLDDLPQVEKNVRDFAALLMDPERSGFEPGKCIAITNPATPDAILRALHQASRQAEELLLFYFSGHGVLLGQRSDQLHLALAESDTSLFWTCLPYEGVARIIGDSSARTKVVLLDCCYSGRALGFMSGSDSAAAAIEQIEIAGTYLMTATSKTKRALALDDDEYTAFTGELLSVFEAGLQIHDPTLPLEAVFPEVSRRMKAAGLPTPQQRNENSAGKVALVRNNNKFVRRTSGRISTRTILRVDGLAPKSWGVQFECPIGEARDPLHLDEELLDSLISTTPATGNSGRRHVASPLLSYLSKAAFGGGAGELLREFLVHEQSNEKNIRRLTLEIADARLATLPWEDCPIIGQQPLSLAFACVRLYSADERVARSTIERRGRPPTALLIEALPDRAESQDKIHLVARLNEEAIRADWRCELLLGAENDGQVRWDLISRVLADLEPDIVCLFHLRLPARRWGYRPATDVFDWVPVLTQELRPHLVIIQEHHVESHAFDEQLNHYESGQADLGEALNLHGIPYALRLSDSYLTSERHVARLFARLADGFSVEEAVRYVHPSYLDTGRLQPWDSPILSSAIVESEGQLFQHPPAPLGDADLKKRLLTALRDLVSQVDGATMAQARRWIESQEWSDPDSAARMIRLEARDRNDDRQFRAVGVHLLKELASRRRQ